MSAAANLGRDLIAELDIALEEGRAQSPPPSLLKRMLSAAARVRPAGASHGAPVRIGGAEALSRAVAQLNALLTGLDVVEWHAPALRDLDVQGLLGHLIGVELAFHGTLTSEGANEAQEHVASTQPHAVAQRGRHPHETLADWNSATDLTQSLLSNHPMNEATTFYGAVLPLDHVLVIRAFEMWIHEEDIRRATGHDLVAPDDARLARMAELATLLLPSVLAKSSSSRPDASVRLVLSGSGGGTWDFALDGAAIDSSTCHRRAALIVLDVTDFCRVVGNRLGLKDTDSWIEGDLDVAAEVFAAASSLALD
jgi:uncharacterized protein (TIGR03083 family)